MERKVSVDSSLVNVFHCSCPSCNTGVTITYQKDLKHLFGKYFYVMISSLIRMTQSANIFIMGYGVCVNCDEAILLYKSRDDKYPGAVSVTELDHKVNIEKGDGR